MRRLPMTIWRAECSFATEMKKEKNGARKKFYSVDEITFAFIWFALCPLLTGLCRSIVMLPSAIPRKYIHQFPQHSLTHSDWAECYVNKQASEQYKRRRWCCFDVIIAQLADRARCSTQPQSMTYEAFGAFIVTEPHWMEKVWDWYHIILMDIRFFFSFFPPFFTSLLFRMRFWRIAFIYSPMELAPTETTITMLSAHWKMNATIPLCGRENRTIESKWQTIRVSMMMTTERMMANAQCFSDAAFAWHGKKDQFSSFWCKKNRIFVSNQREVVRTGNRIKIIMKSCHKFQ